MNTPLTIAAFALGVAAGLSLAKLTQRRIQVPGQASIDTAVSVIRQQDTVIASAVSAFALIHSLYADAVAKLKEQNPDVNTTALDAAVAEAQAATPTLAQAIAAGTDASDEVHTDNGGTGTAPVADGGTVVDPATVDTTAVTGDQSQQQTGDQGQQQA